MSEATSIENDFGCLNMDHMRILILQCADITLRLSDDLIVQKVHCSLKFDSPSVQGWNGQPIQNIVASDSHAKLEELFSDNSASRFAEARWRHLNLITDHNETLPLVLKYFRMSDGTSRTHLLCGRDLRPVVAAERKFHQRVLEIEREVQGYGTTKPGH